MLTYTTVKKKIPQETLLQETSGLFVNLGISQADTSQTITASDSIDAIGDLLKRIDETFLTSDEVPKKCDGIVKSSEPIPSVEKKVFEKKKKISSPIVIEKETKVLSAIEVKDVQFSTPKGFELDTIKNDEFGFFRCVAKELFKDQNGYHSIIQKTLAYIRRQTDLFKPLMPDIDKYLESINIDKYLEIINIDKNFDHIIHIAASLSYKFNLYFYIPSFLEFETSYYSEKYEQNVYILKDKYFQLLKKIDASPIKANPMKLNLNTNKVIKNSKNEIFDSSVYNARIKNKEAGNGTNRIIVKDDQTINDNRPIVPDQDSSTCSPQSDLNTKASEYPYKINYQSNQSKFKNMKGKTKPKLNNSKNSKPQNSIWVGNVPKKLNDTVSQWSNPSETEYWFTHDKLPLSTKVIVKNIDVNTGNSRVQDIQHKNNTSQLSTSVKDTVLPEMPTSLKSEEKKNEKLEPMGNKEFKMNKASPSTIGNSENDKASDIKDNKDTLVSTKNKVSSLEKEIPKTNVSNITMESAMSQRKQDIMEETQNTESIQVSEPSNQRRHTYHYRTPRRNNYNRRNFTYANTQDQYSMPYPAHMGMVGSYGPFYPYPMVPVVYLYPCINNDNTFGKIYSYNPGTPHNYLANHPSNFLHLKNIDNHPEDAIDQIPVPQEVSIPRRYDTNETPADRLEMYKLPESSENLPEFVEDDLKTGVKISYNQNTGSYADITPKEHMKNLFEPY